jgi:hypothetical protein
MFLLQKEEMAIYIGKIFLRYENLRSNDALHF